jgi:hypothetical protein
MLHPLHRHALPLVALAGLIAAGCGPDIVTNKPGEVLVVVTDKDGHQIGSREAELNFGSVFMGSPEPKKLVIRNLGPGRIVLTSLTQVDGDAVHIGEGVEGTPTWSVAFVPQTGLGASEVAELTVTFTPPEANADVVEHFANLLLTVENGREGERTATIKLSGLGVKGHCKLPEIVAFGKVARDDAYRQTVEVRNLSDLPTTATVGAIHSSSGDHTAFTFAPESAQGDFTVEPKEVRNVLIDFRPTENKSYLAFSKMRASAQCPEQTVMFTGQGVESVLSWDPTLVDCGYVSPGVEVTRTVTFTNGGLGDVQLSAIKTQNNTEFRVVPQPGQDPSTLTVPGEKTAQLTVGCKPAVLGPRQTPLTFNTTLARQPSGTIGLKVFGGGPDIDVQPSTHLNFGKVAYFAGVNPPSFAKRKLTVLNVGSAPAVTDVKANLRLGTPDAQGNPQPPYFTVVALNNDTSDKEFEIALPAGYDPVKGLVAKVGENAVDLEVKFTPISYGMKQAKLTIFSNDPDEPAVEIVLSANSVDVPPCNYTVSPTALSFGLISSPSHKDQSFKITNNGTGAGEICLLSGLSLSASTHPFFSLVQGPLTSYEMAPGEALEVLVRVHPQGMTPSGVTNITGGVDFFMSSPLKPQATVGLSAQVSQACLTIAPESLDFGAVQVGCGSETRSFALYNTCPSPVTVTSFAMQSAAGQPAGGPNCIGSQPCPEFLLVQSPAIPTGGLVVSSGQAPVTFQAKYKPIDLGSDTGAIAISAVQGGTNVTYVVTLKGKGNVDGIHTDVFTQDLKPKADVLIAIDDSGSMSGYQASLAANFDSFIKFAESAKVDYHIAVVTTDDSSATKSGRFQAGPSHPEKILTPTTVDVENKFKAKVSVGTSGSAIESCLSPLHKALTAPLVNNENAGFLREDASLAMICVTDAPDQSSQPSTYYLNNFWNIKGHNQKTRFTFNAIAGFNPSPPAGCSYDSGPDDGSYAYLVSQTNGVKDEICTPDWSKTLEELGKTGLGFRTNFFLTSVPDLTKGPIIVAIDGVPVPAVDDRGATVWTYDSLGNGVNFEPMYVPEPGTTLTITYHTTCYP